MASEAWKERFAEKRSPMYLSRRGGSSSSKTFLPEYAWKPESDSLHHTLPNACNKLSGSKENRRVGLRPPFLSLHSSKVKMRRSLYCPNMAVGRKVLIDGTRIKMTSATKARKKKGRMPRKMSSRDTSRPSGIWVATERTV